MKTNLLYNKHLSFCSYTWKELGANALMFRRDSLKSIMRKHAHPSDKEYLNKSRSFEVKISKQNSAQSRFASETVREKMATLSLHTTCSVSTVVKIPAGK